MEEVWRIAESGLAELAKVRFRAEYPATTGRASHRQGHHAITTVTKHSKYWGDGFCYITE